MIKISLLHDSRERPQWAYECFQEWESKCEHPEEVEYILAIDDDDPTLQQYNDIFLKAQKKFHLVMCVSGSRNGVQALNEAARAISPTSELIVSVSDDQGCCKNWDTELMKCLEGIDNFKEPKFIGVSDGLRAYGQVLVYYIANRAYYNRFKYVLYPKYDGVFADNDMTAVARKVGVINAPHLLFQHKHWTIGLSKKDKISEKNDSAGNPKGWKKNQQIYQERAKRNFDL